ncbi:MAG: 1-deoxy-D-xylulose-5-phosphate reductoisomerase [Armatimonadota bacterium]
MKPVNISLLGSTGSIGTQVLDVVKRLDKDRVNVVGLGAQSNLKMLVEQALEFKPKYVCIGRDELRNPLEDALYGLGINVLSGVDGFDELAMIDECDKAVVSIAGTPGLSPTLTAIENKKDVALASKEVLVAAGHIVMDKARINNVNILPIDSEHSAIFQCLNGEKQNNIEKIFLTASGGAFRDKNIEDLKKVTPDDALNHPTWKMGKKVTIDSATLMNKGLEIIEAKWLFGVSANDIEVVIHPQSIIHSMVQYKDASIIAQLGLPDMRLPIQYALLYPERINSNLPRFNVFETGRLTFEEPDYKKYPCLKLAHYACEKGGTLAVVMNAADEVAVDLFLSEKIGFTDIAIVVEKTMEKHADYIASPSIDEIVLVDTIARKSALEIAKNLN